MDYVGKPLICPPNKGLYEWIDFHRALPNFRMRWCTRQIKILPCIEWLKEHPGMTLIVGLRADEEARVGLYGDYASYRYPMREWGWKLADVWAYLEEKQVTIPERTDCALCYGQRLGEWFKLWQKYPERYQQGVDFEERYGHTFRSAQRDSWPASLRDLRIEFENGRRPRGWDSEGPKACRVCTL